MQRGPVKLKWGSKFLKSCEMMNQLCIPLNAHMCSPLISPDLKPVIPEPEVILRFPEVDKLAPPILQLSEVSNHDCGLMSYCPPTHVHAAGCLSIYSRECGLWTSQFVGGLWLQDCSGECKLKISSISGFDSSTFLWLSVCFLSIFCNYTLVNSR